MVQFMISSQDNVHRESFRLTVDWE